MMLANEDSIPCSRLGNRFYPFITVKLCRVKDGRVLVTKSPLPARLGVDGKVDKGVKAHIVPRQLPC